MSPLFIILLVIAASQVLAQNNSVSKPDESYKYSEYVHHKFGLQDIVPERRGRGFIKNLIKMGAEAAISAAKATEGFAQNAAKMSSTVEDKFNKIAEILADTANATATEAPKDATGKPTMPSS